MKPRIFYALASALLITLYSCEPALHVTHDYDKSADFKQYKTFSILALEEKNSSISKLNVERIFNAIKAEMKRKGFVENTSSPDLHLNAVTIFRDKQVVTANTDYYGYGGMYRPYGWGGGMGMGYTTYNVQNYTDGSLIIEVIDAKTNKLLWEGIGNKEIDGPVKDPDVRIPQAIQKIMANFPPGVAQEKK